MHEDFWQRFLDFRSRSAAPQRGRRRLEAPRLAGVITYGDTPEACDAIVQAVLARRRTALIMTLDAWQESGRPIPASGDYRILTDSRGDARAALRSERAQLLPLRSVTEELALREGMDRSLAAWQARVRPELQREAARRGQSFSLDTLLVADVFSLVYFEEA